MPNCLLIDAMSITFNPMFSIEVQPYSKEYKYEITNLILGIQATKFGIPITLDDQPDLQDIPSFYQQGDGNFWVAEGKVVGAISSLDISNSPGCFAEDVRS